MNASGGAAAPLNDASEEYGATAPRHERKEDNDPHSNSQSHSSNSHSSATKSSGATGGGSSNIAHSGQTSSQSTSHKSGHGTHSSHSKEGEHDLDQVSREKAERYVNLNEEDVEHAASQNRDVSEDQRSSQRAPRDVGSKDDVEQIHGKASQGAGNDGSEDSQKRQQSKNGSSGGQQSKGGNSGGQQSKGGSSGGHQGGHAEGGSEFDQEARHKAEKFVNLDDED